MDDACKSFENNFLFRYVHPDWFVFDEKSIPMYREMGAERPAYCLRKRDPSNGSFVFVINVGKYNFEKFSLGKGINALYNAILALFEKEENQILGCTMIFNYTDASLKDLAFLSLKEVAEFSASANKASGRFKKCRKKNIFLLNYS